MATLWLVVRASDVDDPAADRYEPLACRDMATSMCVLGDFAWDVLIQTNTELKKGGDTFGEVMLTPGGSAANVAVWATRSGMDTLFVGKIGRDRFGQLAQENPVAHGEAGDGHLEADCRDASTRFVTIYASSARPCCTSRSANDSK